jgi:hypothetical protein
LQAKLRVDRCFGPRLRIGDNVDFFFAAVMPGADLPVAVVIRAEVMRDSVQIGPRILDAAGLGVLDIT